MKPFGETRKRKGTSEAFNIQWCEEHRAEKSYGDELGLEMCWKEEGFRTTGLKRCRIVLMLLSPVDVLVIRDLPSFLNVLAAARKDQP